MNSNTSIRVLGHLVPGTDSPKTFSPKRHLVPETDSPWDTQSQDTQSLGHLVPRHLVPGDLVPRHFVPGDLVLRHLVPERLVPRSSKTFCPLFLSLRAGRFRAVSPRTISHEAYSVRQLVSGGQFQIVSPRATMFQWNKNYIQFISILVSYLKQQHNHFSAVTTFNLSGRHSEAYRSQKLLHNLETEPIFCKSGFGTQKVQNLL